MTYLETAIRNKFRKIPLTFNEVGSKFLISVPNDKCFMFVENKNNIRISVGKKINNRRYEICKSFKFEKFDTLRNISNKFQNIKYFISIMFGKQYA